MPESHLQTRDLPTPLLSPLTPFMAALGQAIDLPFVSIDPVGGLYLCGSQAHREGPCWLTSP